MVDINDQFSSRVQMLEELPNPFNVALAERIDDGEMVDQIVFGPAFTTLGHRSPASVLVTTAHRRLLATDTETGGTRVSSVTFDETFLLEMTRILLYGRLRIDYAVRGPAEYAEAQFNTVQSKMYRDVVYRILDGINGGEERASDGIGSADTQYPRDWPLKFYHAVNDGLPPGRHVTGMTHWPAVRSGFHKELAPAGALVSTDRELLLLSEDHDIAGSRREQKWGVITTYLPLVRVRGVDVSNCGRFCELSLELHEEHGGEVVRMLFPVDRKHSVAMVAQQAVRDRVARAGKQRV